MFIQLRNKYSIGGLSSDDLDIVILLTTSRPRSMLDAPQSIVLNNLHHPIHILQYYINHHCILHFLLNLFDIKVSVDTIRKSNIICKANSILTRSGNVAIWILIEKRSAVFAVFITTWMVHVNSSVTHA